MDPQGRRHLDNASKLREQGEFLKALQTADEAMIAFGDEKDQIGFTESLAERSLNLRHLYQETEDKNYLFVARSEMQSSVEIARKSQIDQALPIPLFNLAKILEDLGDFNEAVNYYREAIDYLQKSPPQTHNNPAVLMDMKIHLYCVEYVTGDKTALEKAEAVLEELTNIPEKESYNHADSSYNDLDFIPSQESYNKKVWVSGGHMKLAKILKSVDPEKAKKHLELAKTILDSDERLILRFKQWQKLAKDFTLILQT